MGLTAADAAAGITAPSEADMSNNEVDRLAITQLLQDWALWRDTGRWDALRACYTPDARMRTTWYDGPAAGFVDASERGFGKGPQVFHAVGSSTVRLHHHRAIAETRLTIFLRDRLNGVALDVTCHGRVVDRLRYHEGGWRIESRLPIYDKDLVAPVEPGAALSFDKGLLARLPAAYRHLAYLQLQGGARIVDTIPAPNSPEQQAMYCEAESWLAGAPVETAS